MLQGKNLSYYQAGHALLACANLEISSGQLCSLTGLNGAGKSTLLRLLAGIWTPTSGTICWQGDNLLQQPRKFWAQAITYIPQAPIVPFSYTCQEMVAMGRYAHGDLKHDMVLWAMEQTRTVEFRKRPIHQLSQGERQRVYMARALATGASVLLLDEPAAHLDVEQQFHLWLLMEQLCASGRTLIVATHDLTAAARHCTQTVVLERGYTKK